MKKYGIIANKFMINQQIIDATVNSISWSIGLYDLFSYHRNSSLMQQVFVNICKRFSIFICLYYVNRQKRI